MPVRVGTYRRAMSTDPVTRRAEHLARTMFRAAMRAHRDPNRSGTWVQDTGQVAFDVALLDEHGDETGTTARVIVYATGS